MRWTMLYAFSIPLDVWVSSEVCELGSLVPAARVCDFVR